MPQLTCPCGTDFHARPSDIARGKKYCSRPCQYRFATGAARSDWRGDAVGYVALHQWIRRQMGEPKLCSHCDKTDGRFEWANISGDYQRSLDDWVSLCPKCHRRFDHRRESACQKGHPWTDESTIIRSDGRRQCRICTTERQRARRAAGKAN